MHQLHRHINHLFDDFFQVGRRLPSGRTHTGSFSPLIDIDETEQAISVRAELPGLSKDDVTLELHDGVLTIQGEKQHQEAGEKDGYRYRESRSGTFLRRISLPEGIDADAVSAEVKDGVLTVTVPKAEVAQPKRITVATGN